MSQERVTVDPVRMRGLPCIRDTRVTVSAVLGQLACGRTATDDRVLAAASDDGRVIVTADADFGMLLAEGGMTGPSVILLRSADHLSPREQAALVQVNLH